MGEVKQCKNCNQQKLADQFYVRTGGISLSTYCKVCTRKRNAAHYKANPEVKRRQSPGNHYEAHLIDRLHREGIAASPGKASPYNYADVVAWGCVRMEVKGAARRSHPGHNAYSFSFGPGQRENGLQADIIALICEDRGEHTYHLFSADHPVFYLNGRLKSGVTVTIKTTYSARSSSLDVELMRTHMDFWDLIEEKRIEIARGGNFGRRGRHRPSSRTRLSE